MLTEIHCVGESTKAVGQGDGVRSTWGWPGKGGDLGWGAGGGGCTWGHTQQETEDRS